MPQSLETSAMTLTVFALQEHLESVRQTEVERISRRRVSFRPEQQDAIEELTRGIVTRILHGLITALEAASTDTEHVDSAWCIAFSSLEKYHRKGPARTVEGCEWIRKILSEQFDDFVAL